MRIRSPKWLTTFSGERAERTRSQRGLLDSFDTVRRDLDSSGTMDALDRYQHQALEMILGGRARTAFDLDKEDPKVADRYGQGPWGRYTLLARRLVEAGVTFVTVDMPHWDDHSRIKEGHGYKLPHLDKAVGGLMDDLSERGLLDRVLVVVMGEFGRTPKLNTGQPGIPIPGRDHWGNAISVMMYGGPGGGVVVAPRMQGRAPCNGRYAADSATMYHVSASTPIRCSRTTPAGRFRFWMKARRSRS